MTTKKLSSLLGDLEVPVQFMASDEGRLVQQTELGLRTRIRTRPGDGGISSNGEGTGGTDRHNLPRPPRKR